MLNFSTHRISLQQRLLRNLLAVLLPLGVTVTATAMIAIRMATEDMALSLTRQSIKQTSEELQLYFGSIDRLLRATRDWAQSGFIGFDEIERLRRLMQPLIANEPQVASFLLADEKGHALMLLQTNRGWQLRHTDPARPGRVRWLKWQGDPETPATTSTQFTRYDPRLRPWFSGALQARATGGDKQVFWTAPRKLLATGDPAITASVAINGPAGERRVVALDVLLADVTRFTRDLALSENGGAIILNKDAQVLGLAHDPHLSGLDTDLPEQPSERFSAKLDAGNEWPPLQAAETASASANDDEAELVHFSSEGAIRWGARQPFPLSDEQRPLIEVLIPESELLDELAALPKALPPLPGFDLDVWNEPADETCGDTYDVIGRSQDQGAFLMLADATGHGVGTALTATEVRALLRMALRAGLGLSAIAAQFNDQLHEDLGQGRFVTAWLAEVDGHRHRLRTLSAGQAPILRFRKSTGRSEVLSADGPLLGVLPGIAPEANDWCTMAPGAIVAVISDGVYEATNPADEQFGLARSIAIINENNEHPAQAIRERLLEHLAAFTRGRRADDDRTILILKAIAERHPDEQHPDSHSV